MSDEKQQQFVIESKDISTLAEAFLNTATDKVPATQSGGAALVVAAAFRAAAAVTTRHGLPIPTVIRWLLNELEAADAARVEEIQRRALAEIAERESDAAPTLKLVN